MNLVDCMPNTRHFDVAITRYYAAARTHAVTLPMTFSFARVKAW